jgi:hypothetical protein
MYIWLLTVTYLYSSFTATVTTPAVYATKAECDTAAAMVKIYSSRTVAECRAVAFVNKENTP